MTKAVHTRIEQKQMTRAGLIRAASRLFTQNGIANTATADIAKAQKVSHGTVFLHFPTREELILAVIDDFGAKLSQEFGDFEGQNDLRSLLEFHLTVLADYEDFYHRLISEMAQLPAKVKSLVFMLNSAVSWKLFEAARPQMDAGKMKNLTRPELFNTWISLVQYQVMNRELLSEKLPILREKKTELTNLFLKLMTQTGDE